MSAKEVPGKAGAALSHTNGADGSGYIGPGPFDGLSPSNEPLTWASKEVSAAQPLTTLLFNCQMRAEPRTHPAMVYVALGPRPGDFRR